MAVGLPGRGKKDTWRACVKNPRKHMCLQLGTHKAGWGQLAKWQTIKTVDMMGQGGPLHL